MSQGPWPAPDPESAAALDEEVVEPPSEAELEPELPFDPGLPELPLDPELPLGPELSVAPEPLPPPELDDSLVSPVASASGDPLVEPTPLAAQA